MKIRQPVAILFATALLSILVDCRSIQAQPQQTPPESSAAVKAEIQALWEKAKQLRREGKLEAAIETTQKMLAKERPLYDGPNADIAISVQFLAELKEATQDFAAAESARKEVLAILTQVFGERDSRTTDVRLELEDLQLRRQLSPEQRGQLAQAERLHAEARQAYDEGKLRDALDLEKQALKVRQELLGKDHPDVATTCTNIAFIYSEADVLERAEDYYRKAVRIRRKRFGTTHPKYSETRDSLANVLRRRAQEMVGTEKFAEATAALAEALAIRAARHGVDDWRPRELRVEMAHAVRLATLTPEQRNEFERASEVNHEGVNLYNEKKYEEAAEKFEEAVAIRRKLLGVEHSQTLTFLQNCAIAAADLGQDVKAEKLFREVTNVRYSLFGTGHADTRGSMERLANHLEHFADQQLQRAEFDPAIAKRREVVQLRTILLGQSDYRVGDARRALKHANILARLSDDQRKQLKTADQLMQTLASLNAEGQYGKAIGPCRQALDIRKRVLGDEHPSTATSLNNLAVLYDSMGEYAKAEPLYRQSLEIRQKVLGDEHPSTATSLNNLAQLYRSMGDYTKAERYYRKAAGILRQQLGVRHPKYNEVLDSLADVLRQRAEQSLENEQFLDANAAFAGAWAVRMDRHGIADWRTRELWAEMTHAARLAELTPEQRKELEQATKVNQEAVRLYNEKEYEQASVKIDETLAVRRKLLGNKDRQTLLSIQNSAVVAADLGQDAKAEKLFREVEHGRGSLLGGGHPDTRDSIKRLANHLDRLAEREVEREQFEQAIVKRREIVQLRSRLLGQDDWRVGDARRALKHAEVLAGLTDAKRQELKKAEQLTETARSLYTEGKHREALLPFQEALKIRKRVLGEQHPDYAASLSILAEFYMSMGDYAQSEPLYRQALEISKQALGEEHPYYSARLNNLAGLYQAMGHYARAEPLYREDLLIVKKALGEEHANYAQSLKNLAGLYQSMGDYARAEPLCQQALEIRKKALGKEHADYATSLNDLAKLYWSMGDYAGAEPLFRQALEIYKRALGEEHPNYATSLNNLAAIYKSMGDYARAEPLYQQAQEIRKQALGEEHPSYAGSLNNLAQLYESMGDYARAEPLCQQALEIYKRALGEEHPNYATSLNNLAGLYHSMGDYARAEPLFRQAQEITKNALGEEHPSYAGSLNNLAQLYQSMGDYARAKPLYRQVQEILRNALGEQHPQYAASLDNLAGLYQTIGDYAKAEPLYRQALEIRKKALGNEHPDTAVGLNNLAELYKSQGDYSKAEPFHRQALGIRKKALGEQHPDYAASLSNLATLYWSMGDYARAEPLHRQALEIRKKALGEEHPDYAMSLTNLAEFYRSMGDYARAEPLSRQAVEIYKYALGEEHPDYANSLNNLAGFYESMGDYARAEPLYRQALEIRKKALGEEHPDHANSLNNLAALYDSMGDYARAEPLYRQARDIWKKALGEEHPDYAKSLNNLAALYWSMGDYARIEPLYRQTLEIRKKALGDEHPSTAEILINLATLYQSLGDHAMAEPLLRQALKVTRGSLGATSLIQSERQQLVMAEGLRFQLDAYLSLAMASQQNQEQAFREVLAWKGATLVRQRQMRRVGENAEVAPLLQELQQTATRLATLSRMLPAPQQQDAWRRQITELTAAKERLEADLSQKSAEFREAQKQVALEDMLSALPKDAALVDFLEYGRFNLEREGDQEIRYVRSILAFVVRGDESVVMLDLAPAARASEAINTWRRTFGMSQDSVAAGRLLREQIWEPIEKHLEGSKLVLVSTDGVLGRLPIGALPGKNDGTYLLEDYRLAMLPVPQLLPSLLAKAGRKELADGLLVMGDVDYDADPDSPSHERDSAPSFSTAMVQGADTHFLHLPGTVGEIATIKEVFTALFQPKPDAIETLQKAEATEQQFRQAASRFPNLHLATHGFFAAPEKKSALAGDDRQRFQTSLDRDELIRGFNPGLLSGLVFSGANRKPEADKDDGILTADEIAALSLDGVDLVVLSACETGLGEVAGGEGVLGVQRAFQVAGARSTVASLWQVGDVATQLLMERFYRNYWEKKMGKLDALREAQLYLLNHPDMLNDPKANRGVTRTGSDSREKTARLSPQFWAAFSLSGDWR